MPDPLLESVLCPFVIGRDAQLASLGRLLDQSRIGQGQIALISGEAGIGKSRLVNEAKTRAFSQGFTVLQGNCFEPDRVLPYGPILDLLRNFCASQSPSELSKRLSPYGADLVKLLPELATLWPDRPASPPADPEQEKRRLFQILARFFSEVTSHASPLLLIIEDLHWCDDTTLDFLLHLARHLPNLPIMQVLSYRNDEAQTSLKHFLVGLDRQRSANELSLARLPSVDTELMIRTIFEQAYPVRQEFVDKIHTLTEGNPFFVEEILKALMASGAIFYSNGRWERKTITELHIPRTVQVAVAQRVTQLSEFAQHVLSLAAVAGRRFDFSLLQSLTQSSETALLTVIRELLRAQLVIEESADSFAFRHALTQQAIYNNLLLRERRLLHRQIAETLEAQSSDAPDVNRTSPSTSLNASLARHFFEAAQWEKALHYAQLAAENAQKFYAARAALEHLTQALYAAQQLQQLPTIELYRQRGRMYEWLGELDAAHTEYSMALEQGRQQQDRRAEWQCLLDLGMIARERDFGRSGNILLEALALARQLQHPLQNHHALDASTDESPVAHTLVWLGLWHGMMDRAMDAELALLEAHVIFQRQEDRRGIAMVLDMIGNAWYHSGDLTTSAYYHQAALAIYRQLDDRWGQVNCLTMLAGCAGDINQRVSLAPPANFAECERAYEEALHLTRQSQWRAGEAYALIWFGFGLGVRGDYVRAIKCGQEALQIASEVDQTRWIAAANLLLGALWLDLLALPQACLALEPLLQLSTNQVPAIACLYTSLLAIAYIEQGKLDQAQTLLDDRLAPDAPMVSMPQRNIWWARAHLALARQQPAQALAIANRLVDPPAHRSTLPATERTDLAGLNPIFHTLRPVAPGMESVIPEMYYLRGVALLACGRQEEAETTLQTSLQAAQERGLHPLRWRVLASLARVYAAQRRRAEAEGVLVAAQDEIETLALQVPDEKVRQIFRHQAFERLPKFAPATPTQLAKQMSAGLTSRERQVVILLAQGKSNKEIADVMVVSYRTVETHISNILSKLHLSSRAQIILWAQERQLTP